MESNNDTDEQEDSTQINCEQLIKLIKQAIIVTIDDIIKVEKYYYVITEEDEWITLYFKEGKKKVEYVIRDDGEQVIKLKNNIVTIFSPVESERIRISLYTLVPLNTELSDI
jgi:hypothetical protein